MPVIKREYVTRQIFHAPVPNPLSVVRHAYGYDGAEYDAGVNCLEHETEDGEVISTPSLTRQADADDCDINVMMARYQATGIEPRVNPRQPQWGDFTDVPSYQEALAMVQQAKDDFEGLPAEVRARFGNDPAGMLEFLSDEANREEAIKLGLVMPPPDPPPPQRVEIVNPPEPLAKAPAAV